MFNRLFEWSMRRGSRVLFGAALVFYGLAFLQAIAAVVDVLMNVRGRVVEWPTLHFAGALFTGTFYSATMLLFVAMVVHRADDFLSRRG
ncbi:MAG: hypothetical protein U1E23_02820 [Reyranellaceae bacterium]